MPNYIGDVLNAYDTQYQARQNRQMNDMKIQQQQGEAAQRAQQMEDEKLIRANAKKPWRETPMLVGLHDMLLNELDPTDTVGKAKLDSFWQEGRTAETIGQLLPIHQQDMKSHIEKNQMVQAPIFENGQYVTKPVKASELPTIKANQPIIQNKWEEEQEITYPVINATTLDVEMKPIKKKDIPTITELNKFYFDKLNAKQQTDLVEKTKQLNDENANKKHIVYVIGKTGYPETLKDESGNEILLSDNDLKYFNPQMLNQQRYQNATENTVPVTINGTTYYVPPSKAAELALEQQGQSMKGIGSGKGVSSGGGLTVDANGKIIPISTTQGQAQGQNTQQYQEQLPMPKRPSNLPTTTAGRYAMAGNIADTILPGAGLAINAIPYLQGKQQENIPVNTPPVAPTATVPPVAPVSQEPSLRQSGNFTFPNVPEGANLKEVSEIITPTAMGKERNQQGFFAKPSLPMRQLIQSARPDLKDKFSNVFVENYYGDPKNVSLYPLMLQGITTVIPLDDSKAEESDLGLKLIKDWEYESPTPRRNSKGIIVGYDLSPKEKDKLEIEKEKDYKKKQDMIKRADDLANQRANRALEAQRIAIAKKALATKGAKPVKDEKDTINNSYTDYKTFDVLNSTLENSGLGLRGRISFKILNSMENGYSSGNVAQALITKTSPADILKIYESSGENINDILGETWVKGSSLGKSKEEKLKIDFAKKVNTAASWAKMAKQNGIKGEDLSGFINFYNTNFQ